MAELEGHPFVNGPTCHGVAYEGDAQHDEADIFIRGRYPEDGWARNLESHEQVRVVRGLGKLILRSGEATELSQDTNVEVAPGTWFAWQGDVELRMSCSPPFRPEQYEHRSAIDAVIEDYFPDDAEFVAELDEEDRLNFLYRQLEDQGNDADKIFKDYGITEDDDEV